MSRTTFEVHGSFDSVMDSLRIEVSNPDPEVALRSRMLVAMLPALREAIEEENRRDTDLSSLASASVDVAVNFLVHCARISVGESGAPKMLRILAKHLEGNLRRAAQQIEAETRGQQRGGLQ